MLVFTWKNYDCVHFILGLLRRCYQCRSRGDLGSCKDPFKYNSTAVTMEHGLTHVPCASGWCGKVIEGIDGADGKRTLRTFKFTLI